MNRRSFFVFLGLLPVAAPVIVEAAEKIAPVDGMKYVYRGAVLPPMSWRDLREGGCYLLKNELFDDIVRVDIDFDTAIIDRRG